MNSIYLLLISLFFLTSCDSNEPPSDVSILGFELLNDLNGHWVGSNETPFGNFDWFAFDFRPISASHSHSIYEGATNQNIITSIFLAEIDNRLQIMARNGGWLGNQYRATYFILDKAELNQDERYYRLVDAVGGANRSYIEFRFIADSIYIDAYKDNSGSLDQPIHHMGFSGANRNPSYAMAALNRFEYPQEVTEVNLNDAFLNLIDPDSALFLEEESDPFPKSDHGHVSDLTIDIVRNTETQDDPLLLFISKEEIVSASGVVNFDNLDNSVIRTISIRANENSYLTTYLHPDEYYITIFSDRDNDEIPSANDYSSFSELKAVNEELLESTQIEISLRLF